MEAGDYITATNAECAPISMSRENLPEIPLAALADRHIGLTEPIASCYIEAASVCLDRHHDSPTEFELTDDDNAMRARVKWNQVNDRERKAWANKDDATCAGAYAIAIASTELSRDWIAVSRAETKTGADYYVAPKESDGSDLEGCYRLEVSGTDLDIGHVVRRLREKKAQAQSGNSNLPAIAAVVGFKVRLIAIETVE
jgi:hypothetical protein